MAEVDEPLDPRVTAAVERYWRRNLFVMALLLSLWALVGLGCGVWFAEALNQIHWGGFPLGFWFAQQGSIIAFVILVLIYAVILNRLDDVYHRELAAIRRERR
ncbi:MAG: DUF4212 domain-containing protein [Planctomycetes bacterium]|nr:DUF4212 domain-containing protein [Planctomycetota bacterium]